ncbi:MAG: hypothetical protein Q7S15_01675 [bacterium]|nr:hypothetical protein [bacterium]
MSEVIFEALPGGRNFITGGGTRNALKLSRPWQVPLPQPQPETCPFCTTKLHEEIPHPCRPEGWKLFPNIFTPHRQHHLIVPNICQPAEFMQTLGGIGNILKVFQFATELIKDSTGELALFCHIGYHAGQNLAHLHWHLTEVRAERPLDPFLRRSNPLVRRITDLEIVAAGSRAGECIIYPHARTLPVKEMTLPLADAINYIVSLGNQKFMSAEGNPPNFCVSIRISADKTLRYADYCPILNMWGAPEYAFALLEGGPITLPWTHELTAEYLRS